MHIDLAAINVLAELERFGWQYDPLTDSEVKVKCPFHEDDRASCAINIEKKLYKCYVADCPSNQQGRKGGDFVSFLARLGNTSRRVMLEDLAQRYSIEQVKTISAETVERYHHEIWTAKPLLKELYKRGVSDDCIRTYRLGFDKGRITIPIPNENGFFINVRRYLPGAPSHDKLKNTRGFGGLRLYPIEQLRYPQIILCGGEIKAIATASRMNKHGIGAVTATSGEGNWDIKFNRLFRGKKVWICQDVDEHGQAAAETLAAYLCRDVEWVGRLDLPLDVDKYPHGDINDFWGPERKTEEDLLALLQTVEKWIPKPFGDEPDSSEAISLHLAEAVDASNARKRVTVKAVVSAVDTAPYLVPQEVVCRCDKSQKFCATCPIFPLEQDASGACSLSISPESPAILEMVSANKKSLHEALMGGLRLPPCKVVTFSPKSYYNVEDVRLSPQLEIASRAVDSIVQPALCIGYGLESNESYSMTGRIYPHPRTQQSVLLVSEYAPLQDALSSYRPSKEALNELVVFQPDEWTVEALEKKLTEIYDDLSANITRIFKRQDLHLAVDLGYHSVLTLKFDGKIVKGWTEVLIVGDSAQGKTETTLNLMNHYGLGERVECKNATIAGLLGGLQQSGQRWFVSWGVIPTHDKRLVILEEIKGTDPAVIGKLTDMRSSGIAEIPKIEKRRSHARTRLICVSNPRSDRPLSAYNFGIEAIKELIVGPEDIRRFDLSLLVSSQQISASDLNVLQSMRPVQEHKYTKEVCRRLVLWAWTRTDEQVVFTEEALQSILNASVRMCTDYTELVPLVDRGSMRYKLARLATALACRTFSCSRKDKETVVVRECHVTYVQRFLDRVYSDPIFGYRDYSEACNCSTQLVDEGLVRKRILALPFPMDFVEQMLAQGSIELRDLCDWCAYERQIAAELLSFFVRKHCLIREERCYRKTMTFIQLLKSLIGSTELIEASKRPDHLKEEF